MTEDDKRAQVIKARRLRYERAGRMPLETDPLPELYPHHWEDLLDVKHIPYPADYPVYGLRATA